MSKRATLASHSCVVINHQYVYKLVINYSIVSLDLAIPFARHAQITFEMERLLDLLLKLYVYVVTGTCENATVYLKPDDYSVWS